MYWIVRNSGAGSLSQPRVSTTQYGLYPVGAAPDTRRRKGKTKPDIAADPGHASGVACQVDADNPCS